MLKMFSVGTGRDLSLQKVENYSSLIDYRVSDGSEKPGAFARTCNEQRARREHPKKLIDKRGCVNCLLAVVLRF